MQRISNFLKIQANFFLQGLYLIKSKLLRAIVIIGANYWWLLHVIITHNKLLPQALIWVIHFIVKETELQLCFKSLRQRQKQANHITLEAYSEPNGAFWKSANNHQTSTIFTKSPILDVWYASLFFLYV